MMRINETYEKMLITKNAGLSYQDCFVGIQALCNNTIQPIDEENIIYIICVSVCAMHKLPSI